MVPSSNPLPPSVLSRVELLPPATPSPLGKKRQRCSDRRDKRRGAWTLGRPFWWVSDYATGPRTDGIGLQGSAAWLHSIHSPMHRHNKRCTLLLTKRCSSDHGRHTNSKQNQALRGHWSVRLVELALASASTLSFWTWIQASRTVFWYGTKQPPLLSPVSNKIKNIACPQHGKGSTF